MYIYNIHTRKMRQIIYGRVCAPICVTWLFVRNGRYTADGEHLEFPNGDVAAVYLACEAISGVLEAIPAQ